MSLAGSLNDLMRAVWLGRYYDPETDLFENWHRFYDPNTGRYLEPDPIWKYPERLIPRLSSGQFDPVYAYAGNNPISGIEATGELTTTAELRPTEC